MPGKTHWWIIAALAAANLTLLLPEAHPLRVVGAFILIGGLPGWSWMNRFMGGLPLLLRGVAAVAFSYISTSLIMLLLHYRPGPVQTWELLLALNLLALLPLVLPGHGYPQAPSEPGPRPSMTQLASLGLVFIIALFLRGAHLGYSEFQGDEALAMITAAEALEGHEDALFLRSKGPGELLLPMALWRLSGTINEYISRLPFTLASLLAILTLYLIGERLGSGRVAGLAAGFLAFNGFMVAFGRIVQYQALVVWLSALAFLMLIEWRSSQQKRLAWLSGLCLGGGLLAHYDAILALPALGWLFIIPGISWSNLRPVRHSLQALGYFGIAFLAVTLPFYVPYSLDPQASRTGDYVGGRIGNELRNNLPDFFHFNTFYSSSYYIIVTSLLVLAWLAWRVYRLNRVLSLALVTLILGVIFSPFLFKAGEALDLAILPFVLIVALALISLPFASIEQALLLWLAVPFLGYNFVVALGLTHIYTVVPAWSLLAAMAWRQFCDKPGLPWVSNGLLGVGVVVSTIFLWNAFVRHQVEYWQDYPAGNLPLYWTPYEELPRAGFFGFAHRTGWKAVGQKIATGELAGDYGSNEEPDVTTWYTRGAPRACDPRPEFYFLADDLIDPVETPQDLILSQYEQVGLITLPNQKQMRIMQLSPVTLSWEPLAEAELAEAFDQTAAPAAFARSARGSVPAEANFEHLVRLIGYDLDLQRAQAGGRIPVTLYWQALASIPASYQVFTHLESEAGPVAQADGIPVCWTYPTDLWRPGQIIADQHTITLAPEVAPGDYTLEVGLYLPDTFERLDILDVAGNPAGTSLKLATITIGHQKVGKK